MQVLGHMVASGAKLEKRLKNSNKTLDMEYGCIVTMHQHKRAQGVRTAEPLEHTGSAV